MILPSLHLVHRASGSEIRLRLSCAVAGPLPNLDSKLIVRNLSVQRRL